MSVTFRLAVTARAITLISSAAWRPTIDPPSTTPVAGSLMILTKPAEVVVDQRLRRGRERHLGDADLAADGERLGLGQADVGDLGLGEDRARRLVVVEVAVGHLLQAHHVLGHLAALHRRHADSGSLPLTSPAA